MISMRHTKKKQLSRIIFHAPSPAPSRARMQNTQFIRNSHRQGEGGGKRFTHLNIRLASMIAKKEVRKSGKSLENFSRFSVLNFHFARIIKSFSFVESINQISSDDFFFGVNVLLWDEFNTGK